MGQFFCQQCGHRTMDLAMICPDCEPVKWEEHNLRSKKIGEVVRLYREKRERAERYENILCKLVEAQDEIDVEAEKPLHQRSKGPVAKKQEAIKEARRALGGE